MALKPLGPLVLAGSGEYTSAMDIVDRYLLQIANGKPVVLIATSCAMEGEDVMTKWEQMGVEHFRRLGIEAKPVRIKAQDDANIRANAEQIAAAGLIWFSGGSPVYLAHAFHDTLAWHSLEAANRRGAAVAGASGGLGVLNADVPNLTGPARPEALEGQPSAPTALGLADPVRAMAHFDRAEQRRPEFVQRVLESLQPGQVAVGVDEDTTVVWTEERWRVMGHQRVVLFEDGQRTIYHHNDVIDRLPPPTRALEGS
jgi:cyanophycinase